MVPQVHRIMLETAATGHSMDERALLVHPDASAMQHPELKSVHSSICLVRFDDAVCVCVSLLADTFSGMETRFRGNVSFNFLEEGWTWGSAEGS